MAHHDAGSSGERLFAGGDAGSLFHESQKMIATPTQIALSAMLKAGKPVSFPLARFT
jgi:hypothetical protein